MPPTDAAHPSEVQVLCRCLQYYAHTPADKTSRTLVNGKYVDGETSKIHQQLQESLDAVPKTVPDQVVSLVYSFSGGVPRLTPNSLLNSRT
jgi:hypothetical protein